MSLLRAQGGRGFTDSHIQDRFATTYAISYRPYEETRKSLPVRCVPNATVDPPVSGLSSSAFLSRVSNAWAGNTDQPSPYGTPYGTVSVVNNTRSSYQPSISRVLNSVGRVDSVGGRRPWDDLEPIMNKQYPKLAGNCANPLPQPRSSLASAEPPHGSAAFSAGNTNRTYTSTYTTVVADRLDPCSAKTHEDSCKESVQSVKHTVSSCAPCSKSPSTVSGSLNCGLKPTRSTDAEANKTTANERNITVTPISPYQSSVQLDFGQMFSQIARINDHLYLSSLNAITPDRLRLYNITLLVSAMIDSPPAHLRNAVTNCMHVPVEDMEGANLRAHFDRVADRIAAENRRGGRTLVHCMAGVSRSSSLVLAYLVRHMNMSLASAYQHVRNIRPCIQPNPSFWRQLLDYEERIRGSRSVRLLPPVGYGNNQGISATNRLYGPGRIPSRTSYLDMFSRSSGDLLPYRPIISLHSTDSGKPYMACRPSLGLL
ncbi:unnamed protein product [Calicophoron daubneyi]|uniref:Dual specificity protein phosphatase 14 n=1 Tax=Calicophoron daubneyi TaxID=300641 RepID=A0AAV2TND1_CALDB